MPEAPQRPCKHPGCGAFAVAGARSCVRHATVDTARRNTERAHADEARGTAHARGYTSRWSAYARGFRARFPVSPGYLTRTALWTPNLARQFHVLRCLAAERGEFAAFFSGAGAAWLEQFPIFSFHASRVPEPSEQVDHIISVSGPADPLFWMEWNHQALSQGQHSTKTATEDGGFRGSSLARPASRSAGGIL